MQKFNKASRKVNYNPYMTFLQFNKLTFVYDVMYLMPLKCQTNTLQETSNHNKIFQMQQIYPSSLQIPIYNYFQNLNFSKIDMNSSIFSSPDEVQHLLLLMGMEALQVRVNQMINP